MSLTSPCLDNANSVPRDSNKEEREEGGTPDIMGSIRLGLAVQMKEKFGRQAILVSVAALRVPAIKSCFFCSTPPRFATLLLHCPRRS